MTQSRFVNKSKIQKQSKKQKLQLVLFFFTFLLFFITVWCCWLAYYIWLFFLVGNMYEIGWRFKFWSDLIIYRFIFRFILFLFSFDLVFQWWLFFLVLCALVISVTVTKKQYKNKCRSNLICCLSSPNFADEPF